MKETYVTGQKAAARVFKALPEEIEGEIIKALNKNATEMRDQAKLLAPVQQSRGGGRLQASIDIEASGAGVRKDGKALIATVFAGATRATRNAAFRSEFGRRPSPDGHPGHRSQQFFWPAYWSIRERARRRMGRVINKAARLVVGVKRG